LKLVSFGLPRDLWDLAAQLKHFHLHRCFGDQRVVDRSAHNPTNY